MEFIIKKANGDLDEYIRINKYIKFAFKEHIPYKYDILDVEFIRGMTRDDDPVFNLPWYKANTKEKRARYLKRCIDTPMNMSYGYNTPYPYEYCLALYEDEINDIYEMAAITIQKHIKGILTRNKSGFHNPHCDTGKMFLTRMFNLEQF